MNAANIDVAGDVTACAAGSTCARPANAKHAATSASNASALARLVMRCAKSPSRVPRMSSAVKTTTIDIATGVAARDDSDATATIDSPSTSEIAPTDAQVEIQSTHPTRNPA